MFGLVPNTMTLVFNRKFVVLRLRRLRQELEAKFHPWERVARWQVDPSGRSFCRPTVDLGTKKSQGQVKHLSGWWQLKYFLFSTLFGEDEPILTNIFQMG